MANIEALAASLANLEKRVHALEEARKQTPYQDMEDLKLEVEDLNGRVTVLTRAFGNGIEGGGAFDSFKPHVPEPRAYGGARDTKELDNYLFNMEQYFKAVKANSEDTKITMAIMYLAGDTKLWWRTKYDEIQRGLSTIDT